MSKSIKVTWVGGPEDGKTFVWDSRRAPYIRCAEPLALSLTAYDPLINSESMIKTRRITIDQRIEKHYDDDGVFLYAKMMYVADYNKGVVE